MTALEYDADENFIYFGYHTGEIGYINYLSNKRYQPIYQNNLGSAITTLQFFNDGKHDYLLASSQLGKVELFDLGSQNQSRNSRTYHYPGAYLRSIELPESFGRIVTTEYDSRSRSVLIKNSKGNMYSWNPFESSALVEHLKLKLN